MIHNVILMDQGAMAQYASPHYTYGYLSFVTNHHSSVYVGDVIGYLDKKDYKADIRTWKKWLIRNKNKLTLEQTDSIYQAHMDSMSMESWEKWLVQNGDKYTKREKDSINQFFFNGVALADRDLNKRNHLKYELSFLTKRKYTGFYQKMEVLMQDVKKFYNGKAVEVTDLYYAVNYLGMVTGCPSSMFFGKIMFYKTGNDYESDMENWTDWLQANRDKYSIEEADRIFHAQWDNLPEHPFMWFYDDI